MTDKQLEEFKRLVTLEVKSGLKIQIDGLKEEISLLKKENNTIKNNKRDYKATFFVNYGEPVTNYYGVDEITEELKKSKLDFELLNNVIENILDKNIIGKIKGYFVLKDIRKKGRKNEL